MDLEYRSARFYLTFGALKPRNLRRRWWDSTPKHHRFPDFPGRIPKSEVCWAAFQVFDKDCNGTVSFEELEQVLNSASMEGWPSPCGGSNQRMGSFMVDHHFIYQFYNFPHPPLLHRLMPLQYSISWRWRSHEISMFVSVSKRKPQKSVRKIRVSQGLPDPRSQ